MIYAQDYKEVLKDLLDSKPRGESSRLSEYLGVAPALVSQVLTGERHITTEQAFLITNYFNLSENEVDYFLAAVQKSRAANEQLKKYWSNKLKSIKSEGLSVRQNIGRQKELTDAEKAKFYSSYLYSAIRLFCSVDGGQSLEGICKKFGIGSRKATAILNFLLDTNLIFKEGDVYVMSVQSTFVPKESEFVHRHHTNWRMKGLSIMDEVKDPELFYTCPCSLDEETFESLKKDILELISKTVKKTHAAPAKKIACLNIDLFWVES